MLAPGPASPPYRPRRRTGCEQLSHQRSTAGRNPQQVRADDIREIGDPEMALSCCCHCGDRAGDRRCGRKGLLFLLFVGAVVLIVGLVLLGIRIRRSGTRPGR